MSIVQRIQQRQGASVGEAVQQMDQAQVEAGKPDATQQAMAGREAHAKAIREAPEQMPTEEVAAGPEEQLMHEKIEAQMLHLIHGKEQSTRLLEAIFAEQDPVMGIGTIAGDLVLKLKDANPMVTDDVLASIGERVVEEMTELVERANPRIDIEEDEMAEAYSIGLQNYMKAKPQEMDEEEMRRFLSNG